MFAATLAFLVSLALTLAMVRLAAARAPFLKDHDLSGPQKFHGAPVPRVGGIGIVVGMLATMLAWHSHTGSIGGQALLLLACGMPAFVSGLTEDMTKTQSPRRRLFYTAVSAALAVWLVDATIVRTAIPGLDWVVSFPLGAALVTVFVVAGVANSINIIDGFNGLASMCGVLILVSVAYVGLQVGDPLVTWLAFVGAGAVFGFFVCNFPAGAIFLGDGGAYFVGFYIAETAILLLHRNPSVSPMFPLLVCLYPVFETLFSMYRRSVIKGQSPGAADGIHLHSLIYRRVIRWSKVDHDERRLIKRNSMTAPYLWLLSLLALVPATLWWHSTPVLVASIVLFGLVYVGLYRRIVHFRVPRWMVSRY